MDNVVLEKLLCYGMFPEKLSWILSSKEFGKKVINNPIPSSINKNKGFYYCNYNQTRESNGLRRLGIPNPFPYYLLSCKIAENWTNIESVIGRLEEEQTRSKIRPKPKNLNQRLISMRSYNKDFNEQDYKIDLAIGANYIVKTDISNFYPSIYTHTLPWAFVGKKTAKLHRGQEHKTLWYNAIDNYCQLNQDKETKGLPIGCDTSAILSEIIACSIDSKFADIKFLRYIDDYTAFFQSKDKAEEFLIKLSNELANYRLSLNYKKTYIKELPDYLDTEWVGEIKILTDAFISKQSLNVSDKNNINRFWDRSLELQNRFKNDSVIRYCAEIFAKKIFVDEAIADQVIRRIGMLCYHFPYITDCWVKMIYRNYKFNSNNILTVIIDIAKLLLNKFIPQKNSDAVTHLLWLLNKIDKSWLNFRDIFDNLSNNIDCVPLTLAQEYNNMSKLGYDFKPIISRIKSEFLENEFWLFIYEGYRINKTNPCYNDIIHKDLYNWLSKNKITFIR